MGFRVPCPRCGQTVAFDPAAVPVQRAGRAGSKRWALVVAYYPTCGGCGEPIEVANHAPTPRPHALRASPLLPAAPQRVTA